MRLGGAAGLAMGLAGPQILVRTAWAEERAYQAIWDADQGEDGVPALGPRERGDQAVGFVRVDEAGEDPDHRLLAEVVIPERKRASFELCRALFDNYRLDQTKREDTDGREAQETLALLDAITDSAPMGAARQALERQRGKRYDRDQWQELLFQLWFRPFDDGRNLDLSGFEHVVVGEQRAGRLQGYHFWYKYYVDDWPVFATQDSIDFQGLRYGRALTPAGRQVTEVVTFAYTWHARDESGVVRPLSKPVGGFWVGCSVAGLLALGTLRYFQRGRVETVINGARYEIDMFRSPDGASVRSTFPRLLGLA